MTYIFKNIFLFAKKDKLVFLITILCVIISSFIMNFSYGVYYNYKVKNDSFELLPDALNGVANEEFSNKDFLNYLFSFDEETLKKISLIFCTASIEPYEEPFEFRFEISDGKLKRSEEFNKNVEKNGFLESGRYLSEDEEEHGEKVVVMCTGEDCPAIGETTVINRNEYTVVGIHDGGFAYQSWIPFMSVDDKIPMKEISIEFNGEITREIYDNFVNKAGKMIDYDSVEIVDGTDVIFNNSMILISVLVSIISAINFATMYKYILLKRKKSLTVMRLCGCTNKKAESIYLSECILFSSVSYILATMCYDVIMKKCLASFFENIKDAHSLINYTVQFFLFTVVNVFVLYFTIRKNVRAQIKTMLSGGE